MRYTWSKQITVFNGCGEYDLTTVYLVIFFMPSWIEDSIWEADILSLDPLYAFV